MYLKTPNRYSRGNKARLITFRRLWLWIVVPLVVIIGWRIRQERATIGPPVREFVAGVVESAQSEIATAIAPTPLPTQNPAELIVVADAAWQRGAIEDALREYDEILDSVPNHVGVHYNIALGLIMEGQLEEGLAAAERAVTADPFSADAWAIRAMALDWNGRPGEAIASALHALELDPNSARATAFLAEAYLDTNQPERALETVEQALEFDPDSYEAYRVRGLIVWQSLFDLEAAQTDFETAYNLAPHLPYIAIDLAAMERSLNNVDAAIETLRDIVELNPNNTQALYNLGTYYYGALGDPNRAADFLQRCIDVTPNSVNCNYYLGRVQIGLEQYANASESLQKAINLGTDNPIHYWWAGQSQINLGNCGAAIPYLQTGFQLARETGRDDLYDDFEVRLADCQVLPTAAAETPTPEAGA